MVLPRKLKGMDPFGIAWAMPPLSSSLVRTTSPSSASTLPLSSPLAPNHPSSSTLEKDIFPSTLRNWFVDNNDPYIPKGSIPVLTKDRETQPNGLQDSHRGWKEVTCIYSHPNFGFPYDILESKSIPQDYLPSDSGYGSHQDLESSSVFSADLIDPSLESLNNRDLATPTSTRHIHCSSTQTCDITSLHLNSGSRDYAPDSRKELSVNLKCPYPDCDKISNTNSEFRQVLSRFCTQAANLSKGNTNSSMKNLFTVRLKGVLVWKVLLPPTTWTDINEASTLLLPRRFDQPKVFVAW
jgi:hypothetical protein